MLKSILNDRSRDKIHKYYPSAIGKTYKKPIVYVKVEQEVLRDNLFKIFQSQNDLKIKKKYFSKLKFFHGLCQLRKKIKTRMKKRLFKLWKSHYQMKKKSNMKIIFYFNKIRLIKIFAHFVKECWIIKKTNTLTCFLFSQATLRFIDVTLRKIRFKYETSLNSKYFFYKLVSLRLFIPRNKKNAVKQLEKIYHESSSKKWKAKFIHIVKQNSYSVFKMKLIKSIFNYMIFISSVKNIRRSKRNIRDLTRIYNERVVYSSFKANIATLKKMKNKKAIAMSYHKEKLGRKFVSILKEKYNSYKRLTEMVGRYIAMCIIKKKDAIVTAKIKNDKFITRLKQVYKSYKAERVIKNKKSFFTKIRNITKNKAKISIAKEFSKENLLKKVMVNIHKLIVKKNFFKMFLQRLTLVHSQVLKKNYISLLRYKLHRFPNQKDLPHIVKFFLKKKFEKKLVIVQIKKMKNFYQICKRTIKAKKYYIKKLNVAEYFYNKKQMIRIYESLMRLKSYIRLRDKYYCYLQKPIVKLMKKINLMKRQIVSVKKIYSRIIASGYLKRLVLSFILFRIPISIENRRIKKFLKCEIFSKQNYANGRKLQKNVLLFYILKTFTYSIYKNFIERLAFQQLCKRWKFYHISSSLRVLKTAMKSRVAYKEKLNSIKQECLNQD